MERMEMIKRKFANLEKVLKKGDFFYKA